MWVIADAYDDHNVQLVIHAGSDKAVINTTLGLAWPATSALIKHFKINTVTVHYITVGFMS